MSASSRMMLADLPPSSSVTFFTVSDAILMISRPTSVLPVKAILSTSGWVQRVLPSSPPGPGITFITPLGMPAAFAASAMMRALRGVYEAGFNTTVFPVISAGASFQKAIVMGKFQGMIPTHTPIGSLRMNSRPGEKTFPETGISSSQGNLLTAYTLRLRRNVIPRRGPNLARPMIWPESMDSVAARRSPCWAT